MLFFINWMVWFLISFSWRAGTTQLATGVADTLFLMSQSTCCSLYETMLRGRSTERTTIGALHFISLDRQFRAPSTMITPLLELFAEDHSRPLAT